MNNPDMADIRQEFKTKKYYPATKGKPKGNQFKKNVPKKLRKEYGQQMSHLRAILKEI